MVCKGKKSVNMEIDVDLVIMFKRMCLNADITVTEGFKNYLKYLQKQHCRKRKLLDENLPLR